MKDEHISSIREIINNLENLPRKEQLEFMKLLKDSDVMLSQTKKANLYEAVCVRLGYWVDNDIRKVIIELADMITNNYDSKSGRKRNCAPVDDSDRNVYVGLIEGVLKVLKKYSSGTKIKRFRGDEYNYLTFGGAKDTVENPGTYADFEEFKNEIEA